MQVSLSIFRTPKRGNKTEEYEDAYWPLEPLSTASGLLRFAVADGATETSFAGEWARILTRAYCRDELSRKQIRKTLPLLEDEWRAGIETESLPWYAEEKLTQGAFATLVGLTLFDGEWESSAIGDSCLFQVRRGRVITSFPMTSASDFNNHPGLLSSNNRRWEDELENVKHASGTWEIDDEFYLMTDAIACWFLGAIEAGQPAAEICGLLQAGDRFEEWIDSLRNDSGMRNDDVTLLKIRVT
jgi:hypothetical protein